MQLYASINEDRLILQFFQFSNYTLAVDYITNVFNLTDSKLESIEFKKNSKIVSLYSRTISVIASVLNNIELTISPIEMLSDISRESLRIMNMWKKVYTVVEKYNDHTMIADTDEFASFVQEISGPFEEFKKYMKNSKNLDTIRAEIGQAFGQNEDGSNEKPSTEDQTAPNSESENPPATGDTAQSEAKQKGDILCCLAVTKCCNSFLSIPMIKAFLTHP